MKKTNLKYIFAILSLLVCQLSFSQVKPTRLTKNKNSEWLVDSSFKEVLIHYPKNSPAAENLFKIRQDVTSCYNSVKAFVAIDIYEPQIHFFIVSSRPEMKTLIGHQTNATAFPKSNIIAGIFSNSLNSVNSNHELFHLIATNLWGRTSIWLNEGMAVYSDKQWKGQDLYALTKHLSDSNQLIPLNTLVKHFKSADDSRSYPLIGSFVKYLDETYGRETVLKIWGNKSQSLTKLTGKKLKQLESDWLKKSGAL